MYKIFGGRRILEELQEHHFKSLCVRRLPEHRLLGIIREQLSALLYPTPAQVLPVRTEMDDRAV